MITALPYTDTGSTLGMVDDFVASGGMGQGPDVIYVFIAAIAGNYTVSLCGSSYDTGLIIRTGGSCPGTTEIAANDDYCGLSSQASFFLSAGTTCYVIVDACCGNNAGDYSLSISAPVASPGDGESCENALPLTVPGT